MTPFLPARAQAIALVTLLAASTAGAHWLRYDVIENAALALGCDAGRGDGLCHMRTGMVWLFNHGVFGGLALLASVLNLWRPSVRQTALALIASAFGLALYNTAVSALASAFIVMAFARPDAAPERLSKALPQAN